MLLKLIKLAERFSDVAIWGNETVRVNSNNSHSPLLLFINVNPKLFISYSRVKSSLQKLIYTSTSLFPFMASL